MWNFVDIFRTERAWWIVPARLIVALLVLFPIGGRIDRVLMRCASDGAATGDGALAVCQGLTAIEVTAGVLILLGLLFRAAFVVLVLDFAVRTASNVGHSLLADQEALFGLVRLDGDWAYGAMYLAAIGLAYDIFLVGSGVLSLDFLIFRRLAEGHWSSERQTKESTSSPTATARRERSSEGPR